MTSNWQTTAERVCRAVCPDLQGVPVYLLSYDELESVDSHLCDRNAHAWTSPVADLIFCNHLHETDRWAGRGFGAAVDVSSTGSLQEMLGIVMHELAHWLNYKKPATPGDVTPEALLQNQLAFSAAALRQASRWMQPTSEIRAKPWDGHGADFVRASCHLAHRTEGEIESVRPRHLSFARNYYRPPFNENTFLATLADELSDPRPIRDLLATDPPEEFSEVYALATDWFTAEAET